METDVKKITWRHLKKDMKITGWSQTGRSCSVNAIVKDMNPSFVTVLNWGEFEDKITSEGTLFDVEMTEEEFHTTYKEEAKNIIRALKNNMKEYEIGRHSNWNVWISHDPYIIAKRCKREKLTLLGVCTDVWQPHRNYDRWIGICVEDENGEKFWCHISEFIVDYDYLSGRYPELFDGD